jgi:hypothetical protein
MTNSDQIKQAPELEDFDLDEAEIKEEAAALAEAFAAIEEHRHHIPASVYDKLADALQELYDLSQWQSDPEVLREVLPAIIRAAIKKSRED